MLVVVKVWCIPQALRARQFARVLNGWRDKIIDSVLSVPELGLGKRSEVSVIFPTDLLSHAEATTITVEITTLDETLIPVPQACNKLTECVGRTVQSFYPKTFVGCFVTSVNPKQGFWCSDDEK